MLLALDTSLAEQFEREQECSRAPLRRPTGRSFASFVDRPDLPRIAPPLTMLKGDTGAAVALLSRILLSRTE